MVALIAIVVASLASDDETVESDPAPEATVIGAADELSTACEVAKAYIDDFWDGALGDIEARLDELVTGTSGTEIEEEARRLRENWRSDGRSAEAVSMFERIDKACA